MKENFFIKIESLHIQDKGEIENVSSQSFLRFMQIFDKIYLLKTKPFNLSADQLKKREIVYIDIANDPISTNVILFSLADGENLLNYIYLN
jgi:hypothetical protein